MSYSQPKPKLNCKLKPAQPLPIQTSAERFQGFYNDFSVVVDEEEAMKNLITMGYFGKATLSRSFPQFNQHKPEIVRKRVFEKRKTWNNKNLPEKIIVLSDSDSDENEDYLTNLKPLYQIDCSGIKESVHLGLEEAFFLMAALKCLDVSYRGKKLEVSEAWTLFQQSDRLFFRNYIVYYHFRSKNWIVKTGIKFGGDFLLYKQGPPFYHASFVVLIYVVNENFLKTSDLCPRSIKYRDLMGINRLCETAGKELLICEVISPSHNEQVSYNDLIKFKVREILMKRWQPTQGDKEKPSSSTTI